MNVFRPISPLLALLLLTACASSEVPAGFDANDASITLFAMDTVMELKAYGGNGQEALKQASECINHLDKLLSATNPNSEIYAANHSEGNGTAVSDDTAVLLERALELCRDTDGVLDVSIYPAVRAWGFTTGLYQVPEEAELAALLTNVDYTKIHLEDGFLTVPADMEIDLGAVAKGYTGDRIMDIFRSFGIPSAIISLGGNVQTLGTKPDGTLWRVAVQAPSGDGYAGVMEVDEKAVITSGGYERYFEEDGQIYWHIIDPATGWPAQNGLVSVTIISESGLLSDALSTALFVMGKDCAIDFWRSRDDFDFILIDEDGIVTISAGIQDSFSLYTDWMDHELEVVSE